MIKNSLTNSLILALLVFLTACATSNVPAPVVSRTSAVAELAPMPEGRGYYRVKKGDTLFRIAIDAGQNYRDIVTWNNLNNPNDIKVDQVLRVQAPEAPAGAAQPASIVANTSSVEVRPLGAPATSTLNKTGPLVDKRAYSDATLAELEKPEAVSSPANNAEPKPVAESKAIDVKPALASEEVVTWTWPAEGKVVGTFAAKKGIDIAGVSGQAVMAAGAGKVMYAGAGIRGYGNLVIVKHNNNLLSAYAHNKTILVKEGQQVVKGQKIAEMGNSDSDIVKLHFEIRQQGKPVDPAQYLPAR